MHSLTLHPHFTFTHILQVWPLTLYFFKIIVCHEDTNLGFWFSVKFQSLLASNSLNNQSDFLKFLWCHDIVKDKLDPRRFLKMVDKTPDWCISTVFFSVSPFHVQVPNYLDILTWWLSFPLSWHSFVFITILHEYLQFLFTFLFIKWRLYLFIFYLLFLFFSTILSITKY